MGGRIVVQTKVDLIGFNLRRGSKVGQNEILKEKEEEEVGQGGRRETWGELGA